MRVDSRTRVSILDRLLDFGSPDRAGPRTTAGSPVNLATALARDLEWLLNTPLAAGRLPESCHELRKSLYFYGFPDVSSITYSSGTDGELAQAIENAITAFEPRLAAVTVKALPAPGAVARRFVVTGLFQGEPLIQHVTLDALLDLGTRRFSVRGDRDA